MINTILKKTMSSIIAKSDNLSTCVKRSVGAYVMGTNGNTGFGVCGCSSKVKQCIDHGCLRANSPSGQDLDLCKSVHAEQRAILNALKNGAELENGTILVTDKPCVTCAKLIIESGITHVIYHRDYPSRLTDQLFKEAGIKVEHMKEV